MQDQIIQALRQNEADQAVQLAQAWTYDEPGQAAAHRWLALALQQQGRAEDAMDALQQALQLAPDDAQLHLQHAGLLLALRQFEGAERGPDPHHRAGPERVCRVPDAGPPGDRPQ